MKQLSLLDDAIRLSGVMVAIKTAMRDAAGAPEGEGRKMLADRLNEIAQRAGIKLTGGNTLSISKATLDKWLAPSDTSHPPSILALLAFCRATGNVEPFRVAARALGLDLMTEEDRKLRDYGAAVLEMKAARQQPQFTCGIATRRAPRRVQAWTTAQATASGVEPAARIQGYRRQILALTECSGREKCLCRKNAARQKTRVSGQ